MWKIVISFIYFHDYSRGNELFEFQLFPEKCWLQNNHLLFQNDVNSELQIQCSILCNSNVATQYISLDNTFVFIHWNTCVILFLFLFFDSTGSYSCWQFWVLPSRLHKELQIELQILFSMRVKYLIDNLRLSQINLMKFVICE